MYELVFVVYLFAGHPGELDRSLHKTNDDCWNASVKKSADAWEKVGSKGGGSYAICRLVEEKKPPRALKPTTLAI